MGIDTHECHTGIPVTSDFFYGFSEAFFNRSDAIELMRDGYNLDSSPTNLHSFMMKEFPQGDDSSRVAFLAFNVHKIVSSLSIQRWDMNSPKRYEFFRTIFNAMDDYRTWSFVTESSQIVYEVLGMVTHPLVRRMGIASFLVAESIQCMKPAFYITQARSFPIALTLARGLKAEYVTFYAGKQLSLTDQIVVPFEIIQIILEAYYQAQGIRLDERFQTNGLSTYVVDNDTLKGDLKLSGDFPTLLEDVFEFIQLCEVLNDHKSNGVCKGSVVAPVVAIRKVILEQMIKSNQGRYYLFSSPPAHRTETIVQS